MTETALSCPEGPNFAAIAKQLHETALEAEARIFTLEQLLRGAVNRPTIIETTTTNSSNLTANVWEFISFQGGATVDVLFNNTGLPFQLIESSDTIELLGEGVYEVGMYANLFPTGGVTVNSQRHYAIFHRRPDPTQPSNFATISQASYLLFEANAGTGTDCCVVGTFNMQEFDVLDFQIFHDNVAGNIVCLAGAIFWLHKLSDANVLAVT
jgi:hypothetical protein